jgi:transcriptional regulator with XRE-family HTH domain
MIMTELKNTLIDQTLNNIHTFINSEGLKKSGLAKRMGMSQANFYEYLGNKRQGVLDFSRQLAESLGYNESFFIDPNFKLPYNEAAVRALAFSAGDSLSPIAQEGFENLLKICDLIEIYNLED